MSHAQAHGSGHGIVRLEVSGTAILSTGLVKLLDDALNKVEDIGAGGALIVLVTGSVDVEALHRWPGATNIQAVNKWERALRRMERAAALTLVVVEGKCSALALELLLVADRRLARSDLNIQMSAPASWPGMGLYRLVHQIGYARSRKLVLFGTEFGAELCRNFDIIDDITDEDLELIADANLALWTNDDLALRRRLLQDSQSAGFDEALGVHLAACDRTLRRHAEISIIAEA
jgi:isomerase DpgB